MTRLSQFGTLALLPLLVVALGACSGKANNTRVDASKFLGTWKAAPDSELDFQGGPITFKADFTYTAEGTSESPAATVSGPYTVSNDEKLFLGGELTKFGKEGMKIEPDGRLKFTKNGKTIYFVRSE